MIGKEFGQDQQDYIFENPVDFEYTEKPGRLRQATFVLVYRSTGLQVYRFPGL